MSDKILEVSDLQIRYVTDEETVRAVNGVSFTLERGESIGLVGETGAGKTTTALGIMGLVPDPPGEIVGGSILFEDQDLLKLPEKQMREIRGGKISMIFQDPMTALNPVLTIGEQITEVVRLHGKLSRKDAEHRAVSMLEMVGISRDRFHEYPHQFSGGMKQRVVIAIAIACSPKLLIADEPTTALDVTIQDQILKQLRELKKEYGTSIIFITHDLGVVAELCDRVVVLYGGLVMEEASIFDIFEHPSHPYTLGLLASIPALDQDKSRRLLPIPGSPPDMTKPPLGCPFAPRCPYARVICGQSLPEMRALSKDHKSRCWLLEPDAPSEHNPFSREEGTKNE